MKTDRALQLIYFGRINPTKNIDVIIMTLKCLLDAHIPAQLSLIGGCSIEYQLYLEEVVKESLIPENLVSFEGYQAMDYIIKSLSKAHYFIFHSQEPKEGHSNSMTEAMSMGVVPIVSNVGFNASICGKPELVVTEINPCAFAKRIIAIEKSGLWKEYSKFVYHRFLDNYTEMKAIEHLMEAAKIMGLKVRFP